MIEKPSIREAPSNIGLLGRYVLTPEIFDYLKDLKPGHDQEIQLTDALKEMAKEKEAPLEDQVKK